MLYIYMAIAFFLAITFHEFLHAWTANFLGDQTAKRSGRLTLNPLAHIDPFGTVLLPALLMLAGIPPIGYAKPVPINPNNFKNPRVGSAITGVAGPTGNLILATFFSIIYRFSHATLPALATFAAIIVIINVTLMIFNLIPIPPLDGSRLLALVFPQLENPKFELYGFVLLFIFIYLFHGFSYLVPIVDAIVFRAFGVPFTM